MHRGKYIFCPEAYLGFLTSIHFCVVFGSLKFQALSPMTNYNTLKTNFPFLGTELILIWGGANSGAGSKGQSSAKSPVRARLTTYTKNS
jgi:hypothetical protein